MGATSLRSVDIPTKEATFAMACFWSPDCIYGATPGVMRTRVGYSGGTMTNPAYRKLGDHTESIRVEYDPQVITYNELLDIFWKNHDPTAEMKKQILRYLHTAMSLRRISIFPVPIQYTSLIFYHDDEQKRIAEESFKIREKNIGRPLITKILAESIFYDAEDYHQKYRLRQHPWLCKEVRLVNDTDFKKSHLAARLNGYVYGQGTMKQFNEEVKKLGLSEDVADFVRTLIIKYEGQGLTC